MDIGVADESLNGIHYEESSESEEEIDEEETEGEHMQWIRVRFITSYLLVEIKAD